MPHFSSCLKLCQWPAIQFVSLGLMTVSGGPLMPLAAQARDTNYARCADELTALEIADTTAAAACALAFRPTEVSNCVVDVVAVADVAPETALSACSRDRRPDEVATCVDHIHEALVVDDSLSVLGYCHRSLLPERYADCVTGLADALGYETQESLSRCIAAGYRPENIAPTYVPPN